MALVAGRRSGLHRGDDPALGACAAARNTSAIKLAFEVRRIEDLRSTAAALGGKVDSKATEWNFLGFRRCDGIDPEGNVIQLLEPLARQT